MARWLKDFGVKQEKPTEKKSTYGGSGLVRRPQVNYNQEWGIDRAVEDGLKKVTWVYRCVDAIASNAARPPIQVREGDPYNGEIVDGGSLLSILNSQTNPGESAFNFRYRLSGQVLLSSKGAFIEIVRTKGGDIERLNLLHPDLVTPIKDPQQFVKGYEVRIPGGNQNGQPKVMKLDSEDVIWIKKPHPFNPYVALTPLESCGLAIETDYLAKMYNRNFLINDGRPGGMVIIKGDMEESDKEELRARFRGNVMNAGRISVIASDQGADFVDTAVTPRDAQYIESREVTKQEIQIAFGVPESVLGNASGRTWDNAEVERLVFWMETMLPHMDLIFRPMDVLTDDLNGRFLSPDLSRVDVLQRMETKRREFLLREFDGGAISVDEYRAGTGRVTLDDVWGETLFTTTRKVPFATLSGVPVDPIGPVAPTEGAGRPEDDTVVEEPEDEPREREDDRIDGGVTPNKSMDEILDPSDVTSAVNDAVRWRAITESTLKRFCERQAKVVMEKVSGSKSRKAIERKSSIEDIIGNVFNDLVWAKQIDDDIRPIIKGIFREMQVDVDSNDSAGEVVDQMINEVQRANFIVKSRVAQQVQICAKEDNEILRVKDTLAAVESILGEASLVSLSDKIVSMSQFEAAKELANDETARIVEVDVNEDEDCAFRLKSIGGSSNPRKAYYVHVDNEE